jgi:glutamine amidotransferase
MKKKVIIVDYGLGNIFSVQRAVEAVGDFNVSVSNKRVEIANADRIILPGVGAFSDGMQGLQKYGLIDELTYFAKSGVPILGICLGMQLLTTSSEEFGNHKGLNLISGSVKRIPNYSTEGEVIKVPFISWAPLEFEGADASNGLFSGIKSECVYLVHSYQVIPDDQNTIKASYTYGGHKITAAIRYGNIHGVQFHPEKSGRVGLRILKNFLQG